MTSVAEIENRARLARTTCGWPKPQLDRNMVRRYWRDVHSPCIARRAGIYQYRHSPFDAVRTDLFAPIDGVDFGCAADRQIQWQSDVAYLDETWLDLFFRSPSPEITKHLLADIEMIVDKSTTYRSVDNAHTFIDTTARPIQQGPVRTPTYGLFFRQRSSEGAFRDALRAMARRWSTVPGVERLRLSLFERPDMEAERKAGYPVKTHVEADQYQAWIDLVLTDDRVANELLT